MTLLYPEYNKMHLIGHQSQGYEIEMNLPQNELFVFYVIQLLLPSNNNQVEVLHDNKSIMPDQYQVFYQDQ